MDTKVPNLSLAYFRLLLVFAIALSFVTLPGPLGVIPPAHANQAPQENWYPAGPAMNNYVTPFFTDENSEFNCLQTGCVDLTDWPMSPTLVSGLLSSPNIYITSPISAKEYFELEFHLGTNFWGCPMAYGNSACGKDIRQGIAHLIDKTVFTTTQGDIAGAAIPIDNPYPPSTGLPAPNPCGWDTRFNQTGSSCAVGTAGGTAYHIASAIGVNYPWQQALGSPDFCAAATHFVAAGLATGMNPTTCVLTGITSTVTTNPIQLFARSDSPPRLELGNGVGQELCALFTGSFTTGCSSYVTVEPVPITGFSGFTTSPTSVQTTWNMYTAGFTNVLTFDSGFFTGYNSQFVSGIPSIQPPNGPCSASAVPSYSAGNYMYLCNSSYDNISNQMEFSPCLNAPGDPTSGQITPTFANCPSSTQLTATSAGYKTADLFGRNAYTIPIWSGRNQYGYLSNWQRVILHQGVGLLNYFSPLNAYSTSPAQPQTIRQGFKQLTHSLNPYIASSFWDFGIVSNIWDSLNMVNPEANGQLLEWMTLATTVVPNSQLGYVPPSGTVATYRFNLRNDLYWQDHNRLSAWDVAFTYQTLKATGSFQGTELAPVVGVRVISANQLDVNVNGNGPFTRLSLTQPTIIPGRYWSGQCPGGTWDGYVSIGNVPSKCMSADPNKILPGYDPLAAGTLIGSGPWMCKSAIGIVGQGCSSTGSQNPPIGDTYSLQRYGLGTVPGGSLNTFFRSNGNLALWIWSQDNGDFGHDFLTFSILASCYQVTPVPAKCTGWSMGIGNGAGTSTAPAMITSTQVSILFRFQSVNWVAPFDWRTLPPQGIAAFPPVLYEGSATLNPGTVAGCATAYSSGGGYDC